MRTSSIVVLTCAAALASTSVAAAPKPNGWSGTVAGGYIKSSGNSDSGAATFKLGADYTLLPWTNSFNFSATNATEDNRTTEERYALGDKLKFNFNAVDYSFASFNYDSDRFAGITERYAEAVGYGRRLLQTERQILDLELGVGANQEKTQGEDSLSTQFIGLVGGKYIYEFSPTSEFSQSLRTEIGTKNTFINPVSELRLTIVGRLYATLDYEVRYNTTAPEGTVHTDTITSINFGYDFGKRK